VVAENWTVNKIGFGQTGGRKLGGVPQVYFSSPELFEGLSNEYTLEDVVREGNIHAS
jgi:hypothetical protein